MDNFNIDPKLKHIVESYLHALELFYFWRSRDSVESSDYYQGQKDAYRGLLTLYDKPPELTLYIYKTEQSIRSGF